jgi:hypothetical protein
VKPRLELQVAQLYVSLFLKFPQRLAYELQDFEAPVQSLNLLQKMLSPYLQEQLEGRIGKEARQLPQYRKGPEQILHRQIRQMSKASNFVLSCAKFLRG